MLRLILRPLLVLITVLALCVGAVRVGYGLAVRPQPDDVFVHPRCDNPCWHGMEIGTSTEADMRAFIAVNDVAYSDYVGVDVDGPLVQLTFMYDGVAVQATLRETLNELILGGVECPMHFMAHMGEPDMMAVSYAATLNAARTDFRGYFNLFYTGRGYDLEIDSSEVGRGIRVVLRGQASGVRPGVDPELDWSDIMKMLPTACD
ncbi:MAG: hypothetical protein AAF787_17530 [Chloroflexota bacterium]